MRLPSAGTSQKRDAERQSTASWFHDGTTRPPAQHTRGVRFLFWSRRIYGWIGANRLIHIMAPFPYVPMHIVQSPFVRRLGANRVSLAVAVRGRNSRGCRFGWSRAVCCRWLVCGRCFAGGPGKSSWRLTSSRTRGYGKRDGGAATTRVWQGCYKQKWKPSGYIMEGNTFFLEAS